MIAHTLGNPFDLARGDWTSPSAHNLWLIEDCCDALGATYDGQAVGTFGDLATLSFYPAHHITMGEGGAVLTNRRSLKTLVESFRDWGRDCWCAAGQGQHLRQAVRLAAGRPAAGYDHKYTYSHLGYNLKITDMQAAVGVSPAGQARRLHRRAAARISICCSARRSASTGSRSTSSFREATPDIPNRAGSASC